MFVGRTRQLQRLSRMYESDRFECGIIYGRRRIGKTHLIKEFTKDKPTIFFQAIQGTSEENLRNLTDELLHFRRDTRGEISYGSFERVFHEIETIAKNEPIVFVIDEYPYLAESYPAISSILQKLIDHSFKPNTNMTLLLAGSSMSFMERQVLGYKSPLYGRRTAQFKLEPFTIWETKKMLPAFLPNDLFIAHAITGGVPYYLSLLNDQMPIKDNIVDLFLEKDGFLYQEKENLLLQELSDPSRYNSLIRAIAAGASKRNQIATKAGVDYNQSGQYLQNLIDLGIVQREYPLFETHSRKSIYSLKDDFFRFWFRFIPSNMNNISSGRVEEAWEKIDRELNDWLGKAFEDLSLQWCIYYSDQLPIEFESIGRWWGNNPKEKKQEEIDLIAYKDKKAVFIECKYRNDFSLSKVQNDLIRKSELFPQFDEKHYVLFVKEVPQTNPEGITIISLDDILNADNELEKKISR